MGNETDQVVGPCGKRLNTVEEVAQAARDRRAVFMPSEYGRRLPAAVVINFQASHLLRVLGRGVFLYTPRKLAGKDGGKDNG